MVDEESPMIPFPESFLPSSPEQRLALIEWQRQIREAAQREDGERLRFVMQDIDGFYGIEPDKYDLAMKEAAANGRDEPNADDELAGIRALIDLARQAKEKE